MNPISGVSTTSISTQRNAPIEEAPKTFSHIWEKRDFIANAFDKALTPHRSFLSADDRLTLRDLIRTSPPTAHVYEQIAAYLKKQKDTEWVAGEDVKDLFEVRSDYVLNPMMSHLPHFHSALRKAKMDTQLNELAMTGLTTDPGRTISKFNLQSDIKDQNGNKVRELDQDLSKMIRDAIYVAANKSPTFRGAVENYDKVKRGDPDLIPQVTTGVKGKINITVIDNDEVNANADLATGEIKIYTGLLKRAQQENWKEIEWGGVKANTFLTSVLTHETGHTTMTYRDGISYDALKRNKSGSESGADLREGTNQYFNHRVGQEIDPNIKLISVDTNGIPEYGAGVSNAHVWSR